jgi:hypothetical protein
MIVSFPNTAKHLSDLDLASADKLDIIAKELIGDELKYERASQALRRRFSRGAKIVEGIDRGERKTRIKREKHGGKYKYFIEGTDGSWNEPQERIWVVAMYALWQASKKKS